MSIDVQSESTQPAFCKGEVSPPSWQVDAFIMYGHEYMGAFGILWLEVRESAAGSIVHPPISKPFLCVLGSTSGISDLVVINAL